jgi:hypothetical protein
MLQLSQCMLQRAQICRYLAEASVRVTSLESEAAFKCRWRILCRGLAITMADFQAAIARVQPSVRREGFTTTPDITWDDVGSLTEVHAAALLQVPWSQSRCQELAACGPSLASGWSNERLGAARQWYIAKYLLGVGFRHDSAVQVREELSFAISQPIEHPERFAAMGLSTATGVLLYGPPGALVIGLRGDLRCSIITCAGSPQAPALHLALPLHC